MVLGLPYAGLSNRWPARVVPHLPSNKPLACRAYSILEHQTIDDAHKPETTTCRIPYPTYLAGLVKVPDQTEGLPQVVQEALYSRSPLLYALDLLLAHPADPTDRRTGE